MVLRTAKKTLLVPSMLGYLYRNNHLMTLMPCLVWRSCVLHVTQSHQHHLETVMLLQRP